MLRLHQVDQFEGVRRRRRHARLRLDVAGNIQAEVLGEVRPGVVIRDDLRAAIRRQRGHPAFVRFIDLDFERVQSLLEILRVGGTQLGQTILDLDGDAHRVGGIEPVVGIAHGMDVAHGASDGAGGTVEDLHALRDVEIAARALADLVVAALLEQRRKPSDLQLQSDDDEKVGAAQLKKERRLRLDEVRILISLGDGHRIDAIAADFVRQRGEIGDGGDDFQFVGGEGVRRAGDEKQH